MVYLENKKPATKMNKTLATNQSMLNAGPGAELKAGGTSPGTWGNSRGGRMTQDHTASYP